MKNFETVRKRWLHAELELKKYKELLVKSDVAKAALEVKLKHVRNQLDVEMKKRIKVEGDYQYLVRTYQPINNTYEQFHGLTTVAHMEKTDMISVSDH